MERADLEQWRGKDVARLLALVENQRRYYQEIVASLPVGVLVFSSNLEILMANRAFRSIMGLEAHGPLPARLDTLLPASVLDRAGQVVRSGAAQANILVEIQRGGKRRLRVSIAPTRSWDDAAPEVMLTVEDLSAAATGVQLGGGLPDFGRVPVPGCDKEALSALDVIQGLNAIVWVLDARTKSFLFVSQHAENVLGFPTAHWTGTSSFWTDRVHPADREAMADRYQRVMDSREAYTCEFRALNSTGRTVWLRESARFLVDSTDQITCLIGITVDVTERRLLENQMASSQRVDAVGKLAGRMAHDLNNMLMIVQGYQEELLSATPATSPSRNDIQEIVATTGRMAELAGRLLAFTRRRATTSETVDLGAVLNSVSQHPNVSGVDFRSGAVVNGVKANAVQLEEMLLTLIERTRQTAPPESKLAIETRRVEIREDLRRSGASLHPGRYIVVSLTSTVRLPDRAAKSGWLESFLPGKDASDELAMALTQAYGIVRQWGGDISPPGEFTETSVFGILLELAETTGNAENNPGPPPVELAPIQPQRTNILVVEDEVGIRALVRKILQRHGYEVLEAASGEEALTVVREHASIDLLITDMMMPHMTGRELVDRLRQQGRDTKVLYISGYTDDPTVYSGDLPPGTAFLPKPFTLSSLLDKVRDALKRS